MDSFLENWKSIEVYVGLCILTELIPYGLRICSKNGFNALGKFLA